MMTKNNLKELSDFPLLSALLGRRSRRFAAGAKIESGPFAFTSKKPVQPLDELELALIVSIMAGEYRLESPHSFQQKIRASSLPNYAGSASARTFPSSAGFHTSNLFFTDDTGGVLSSYQGCSTD
jgi:hypothetical protein